MSLNMKRWASIGSAVVALVLGLFAINTLSVASANTPDPTTSDTARLLGYLWADGSFEDATGVWDLTTPSGGRALIEELVERHNGQWVDQADLKFRLPAPYNWTDWKDSLPNDDPRVSDAVRNSNFLAAVLEGEGAVDGLIYDQSSCCTPGFTQGRLLDLQQLLFTIGYESAEIHYFGNRDSGRVTIDSSEFQDLRSQHEFVCPAQANFIRIPGGTNYAEFGSLRWLGQGGDWSDVVRSDCAEDPAFGPPTAPAPVGAPEPVGTCTVESLIDGGVQLHWGDEGADSYHVRRNNRWVSSHDGAVREAVSSGSIGDSWVIRYRSQGVVDVPCQVVGTPAAQPVLAPTPLASCTARPAGDGVQLQWGDEGADSYHVRRNNRWVSSHDGAVREAVSSGSIGDSWVIRYRSQGVVDVPCQVIDGQATIPCAVTATPNGISLDWGDVAGIGRYQVRQNGLWIGQSQTSNFLDAGESEIAPYDIRYRSEGNVVTVVCEP